MRCQQRKARGYSKRSRDVPAADLAPPAHALELIPERYRRPIARPVGISVAEVGENRRRDPMASGIQGGSSAALDFTVGEMTLLRPLIAGPPTLIRHTLSRELCQGIGWFKPAGGLNDSMAWVPMLTDRPATARPNDYVSVVTLTGKTIYDLRTHQMIHVSR